MRILVTGHAGFIGSCLSQSLLLKGHEVIGIDNFNDYYSPRLKKERIYGHTLSDTSFTSLNLDISELHQLESVFESNKFDVVIHLAAQAGVRLQAQRYVSSNIVGFANILDCVRKYKVKNFLFASSSSIYGNSKNLPYVESDVNLSPTSFYGLTKKLNEDSAEILSRSVDIKMRALRFFTVYGPWGRPDMAYFRLITSAIHGKKFELYGDGSVQRDFTYVSDVVEVVEKLMDELISRPESSFYDKVNIGGDRPLSINYLISEIEKQSGRKIDTIRANENVTDSRVTASSKDYMFSLIGAKTYIKLEEGITRTLQWANDSNVSKELISWVESSK
jgi:UDP-glucuronate 4-epimerase